MDETNTKAEYRPAADFYPYDHADAIKGISECLHYLFTEGPAVNLTHANDLRASICGMLWIQQKLVRELHEWLVNIENLTDIDLPIRAKDFDEHHVSRRSRNEVREPAPLYSIN